MAARKQDDDVEPIPGRVGAKVMAELLGISERHIHQLVHQGAIPPPERRKHDVRLAMASYCTHLRDRMKEQRKVRAAEKVTEERGKLYELRRMRELGEVIDAQENAQLWAASIGILCDEVERIWTRVTRDFPGAERGELRRAIQTAGREALNESHKRITALGQRFAQSGKFGAEAQAATRRVGRRKSSDPKRGRRAG